jgi:hypothetical protein
MNTVASAIGSPDGAVSVPLTVGLCEKRTSRLAARTECRALPRPTWRTNEAASRAPLMAPAPLATRGIANRGLKNMPLA